MLQSVGVQEIAGHPETEHVAVNGALRSIYGWAVSAFFVGVGGGRTCTTVFCRVHKTLRVTPTLNELSRRKQALGLK